jgi:prepilin-type N-terminal cleavage/methylation domain-containing protein
MKSWRRNPKNCGFTLLELLVVFFIFAIVIVAVYGAYFTTNTAIDAAELQAEINTKARTAMERITTDLKDIFLGQGGILEGKTKEILGSRADTLRFTSTAHIAFTKKEPPVGVAMIRYSVYEETGTELLSLYRLDIPYRPGYLKKDYSGQKGYLLCDGLRSVHFIYIDQEGNEVDDWQVEEGANGKEKEVKLPVMIEIVLRFAAKGLDDLIFKTAIALPSRENRGSERVGQ